MLDQYRLKLKDGTILAVDFDGLRTWLIDEKVMVQPPGSRKWRPLRQVLAQGRPEALIPRPASVPVTSPPPPAPAPAVATPRSDAPLTLSEAPIPLSVAPSAIPVIPEEEYSEPDVPLTVEPTAPLAEPVAPKKVKVDDGIAVIPLKPLDDDPPIHSTPPAPPPVAPVARRPVPTPEPVDLLHVAAAEVERHNPAERPWQWTAPDPRAAAAPSSISFAAAEPAPPQDVYDEEAEPLPELDMVEEKPPIITQEKVAAMVRDVSQQADRLLHDIANSPVTATAQAKIAGAARRSAKWALPAAGVLALVLGVTLTRSVWRPWFTGTGAGQAAPAPPTLPPAPEVPPPPPEVAAAIERLPHLAPETIQLVVSTSRYAAPDPPEVFRLAYLAADRGASSLTDEEARELRELRSAVLGSLRSVDRNRVLAYGRMTAGRDLLVAEDAKVLALYSRGVRALPPPRRERLQALLGKAIAVALKDAPRATPLPR